jgi:hypothetical protein
MTAGLAVEVYDGVHVVYASDQQPTAGSNRAPQFCAYPPLPGTTRHSKPARLAADVHLPALTIITRHYATLGTANF